MEFEEIEKAPKRPRVNEKHLKLNYNIFQISVNTILVAEDSEKVRKTFLYHKIEGWYLKKKQQHPLKWSNWSKKFPILVCIPGSEEAMSFVEDIASKLPYHSLKKLEKENPGKIA